MILNTQIIQDNLLMFIILIAPAKSLLPCNIGSMGFIVSRDKGIGIFEGGVYYLAILEDDCLSAILKDDYF